jgi:signal transduction histidine kinase
VPELASSERLAAIARSDLYAGVPEPTLEPYARIVARLLDVPVALISIVTDDRQFFPASVGLDEPWRSRGETPLSMSFCQHVVVGDAPLVVPDALQDERVAGNGAIAELDVVAYLGVPLRAPDGQPLGSVCAIDHRPRQWSDADLELLQEVAQAAAQAVSLRTSEHLWAEFAAEASHHLRTPVAAVQLELDDLGAWATLDDEARAVVRSAASHVAELAAVVGDLTEVAHTRRRLGRREVDLVALARAVADDVDLDHLEEPLTISTSPSVLRHALHELVRLLDRPVRISIDGLEGSLRLRVAQGGPVGDVPPVPPSLADLVRTQLGGRATADAARGGYELVLPVT